MAFGKKRQIETLQAQLDTFKEVEGYISDATAIHEEVSRILAGEVGHYSTSQITTLAVDIVSRRRHDEVYNKLAEEYALEYENEILQKALDDLREKEGAEIREQVRETYAINPTLQVELAKKARTLLWQEEEQRLQAEIQSQQHAHIESELSRQAIFNTHTVNFALRSSLNLASEELLNTFQQGDVLLITPSESTKYQLAYTYDQQEEQTPLWRYLYSTGIAQSDEAMDRYKLYELRSFEPGKMEPTTIKNTLRANCTLAVSFVQRKRDTSRTLHTIAGNVFTTNAVELLTPIAHERHQEQQQN